MDLELVRSATLSLRYGGTMFLIDPMLAVKHAIRPMGDSPERNPTVDLPYPIDRVLADADVVVCSHLHPDHFDDAAFGVVPRRLPIVCQPTDAETFRNAGFETIAIDSVQQIGGVEMTPTGGQHGTGPVGERMGHVMGLVFRHPGEPTLYWVGDTIMCDTVRTVIAGVQPDVIVTHSGGATVGGNTIIMDVDDTLDVARNAPDATIIAVHLEAVAHAPVTRAGLRAAADMAGITAPRLRIPADGETITLAPLPA